MKRVAVLTLCALLAAAPAAAGSRATVSAVRVEAPRTSNQTAVVRQLNKTARALCARTASPLFPGHEGRAWRCRREAVAAALLRRGADVGV